VLYREAKRRVQPENRGEQYPRSEKEKQNRGEEREELVRRYGIVPRRSEFNAEDRARKNSR